ncbi:hypothetical protein BH09MYX1_BH09MYX1_03250 [soil metagenome]
MNRSLLIAIALAASAVIVACSGVNSIVGAECADGYVQYEDSCVSITAIADGNVDGSKVDGAELDGYGGDGRLRPDGEAEDGEANDGSSTSDGALDGGGGGCDAGLTLCGNECVYLQTNPTHCGVCGNVCTTLICAQAKCQGALNGHVVVIGHDYAGASSGSQQRLLANAALIPTTSSIRVRSWEASSNPAAFATAKSIISNAATVQNRSVVYTVALLPSDVLSTTVVNTDVLLLHDQPNATPATLGALGTSFAATLATFTKNGGVVIVTDGGSGPAPQMSAFVKNAALLDIDSETAIPFATSLTVAAPADAVGLGVLGPYAAGQRSVYFACNDPNSAFVTWVVIDPSSDGGTARPVVVHRIVP